MKAAIEEDNNWTCGKLAEHFLVSDETVRLHLHRIGKAYKFSKWVPYTLSESNKQRETARFLLLSRHRNIPIFDRVRTIEEKWVLYDTPKRARHHKTTSTMTNDDGDYDENNNNNNIRWFRSLVDKWCTMSC